MQVALNVRKDTMPTDGSGSDTSPRKSALNTLTLLDSGNLHADDLIDRELSSNILHGPDRRLYAELVFGVLRHQARLDFYLRPLLKQPTERLDLPVLLLLRLGLYQICYLDRVPQHAAVYETVELAKQVCPKAKGLINGVLRSFLRQPDLPALPDSVKAPVNRLSVEPSVPAWLANQWLQQFTMDEATGLAAASNAIPQTCLRINSLKTTRPLLLELFSKAGISAAPTVYSPEGITLNEHFRVTDLPGFTEGLFTVQDESSQLIAHLVNPLPGELVLDVCAAPGGKTTHLAQLMADNGRIIATDIDSRRIKRVQETIKRLGITSVTTETVDVLLPDYQNGLMFDRILLDAPCSGLGVIRRNPEAKWRLTTEEIGRCALRQGLLLESAARLLKPGGIIVYATCSTAIEEDEAVVEYFVSRHPEFMIQNCAELFPSWSDLFSPAGFLRTWPHRQGCDGFFAARLQKRVCQ